MSSHNAAQSANADAAARPTGWSAAYALAARELVRFFRQRTRIVGALGQPVIFWVLFGAGLRGSFQPPEWAADGESAMSYQEYFFPGVAVMIVMFTAIFSTISIIEDRREGFLQGVLVSPTPRWAIVLGKLTGGAALAIIQVGLFLLIGPLLGLVGLAPGFHLQLGLMDIAALLLFLILLAYGQTALGYLIAWRMESTHGFHAIMSVFLMPMWLLSGAFFPGEQGWIAWVIRVNPLSYGVAGLRQLLNPRLAAGGSGGLPSLAMCTVVTLVFMLVCAAAAVALTRRRTVMDSQ